MSVKDTHGLNEHRVNLLEIGQKRHHQSLMWHVKMFIPVISSFTGTAKQVEGAGLSSSILWHTLLPDVLTVEGHIDGDRSNE